MNNYQKIKCVQGLIISLDEQIYRLDRLNNPKPGKADYDLVIEQYFNAIKEQLDEPEKQKEDNKE